MLWVPRKGVLRREHNTGTVGAANVGTQVTTGAASGTKGSVAQLIASTSFDAYFVIIWASGYAATATTSSGCLDIMIGAATEEVIIPDLLMGGCASGSGVARIGAKYWMFPLYIPSGSRLSAKAAGSRVSTAMTVAIWLYGGDGMPPFRVGSKVTTYGVTVPNGTAITPGGSGAEGSWTQITASTSEDHFCIVPSFQLGNDTVVSNNRLAVDVGVGAATEEEIVQSEWYVTSGDETGCNFGPQLPTFQDIPSGSRLSMRASDSGTNDAYDGALHCVS